jgi:hypothetical protein
MQPITSVSITRHGKYCLTSVKSAAGHYFGTALISVPTTYQKECTGGLLTTSNAWIYYANHAMTPGALKKTTTL